MPAHSRRATPPAAARERIAAVSRFADAAGADDSDTGGWVPPHDRAPRRVRRQAAAPAGPTGALPGEDAAFDADPDRNDPGAPTGRHTSRLARLAGRGPWAALTERWVPESLRTARMNPGRRGAALLAVVAAIAAIIAAVGVWWHRPQPVPVTASAQSVGVSGLGSPVTTNVSGSPSAGSAIASVRGGASTAVHSASDGAAPNDSAPGSPGAGGPILVSVTGRVTHPGLVSVPPDARVADAIAAAGGAIDSADLTGINLAARLDDGDSVVVAGPAGSTVASDTHAADGAPPTGLGAGASASGAAPIDINTADGPLLEQLPGIGPVTAAAIVAWRQEHGPFTSIEQLQAVSGIGPATFARVADRITV